MRIKFERRPAGTPLCHSGSTHTLIRIFFELRNWNDGLNRYRLKHLQQQGHKGALRAGKLLARPDRLIGLILIGNNLVNISGSPSQQLLLFAFTGCGHCHRHHFIDDRDFDLCRNHTKTIAAIHPEKVAFPASIILLPLMKLAMPLVWSINAITNGLLSLLGFKADATSEDALTQEELRTIVSESGGLIPRRHRNMLVNILDLEQVSVNDIMVPGMKSTVSISRMTTQPFSVD